MTKNTDIHSMTEAFLIDGYRRMPPVKKLKLALEMTQTVTELAKLGIKQRHPGISDLELNKRLGAILLGRELSIKVNNWDPQKEGY